MLNKVGALTKINISKRQSTDVSFLGEKLEPFSNIKSVCWLARKDVGLLTNHDAGASCLVLSNCQLELKKKRTKTV